MITINLSDEQARELLDSLGWRIQFGSTSTVSLNEAVAREIFTQLENRLIPPGTEQANLAAWRAEAGYTAKAVEDWKRKHETLEESGL